MKTTTRSSHTLPSRRDWLRTGFMAAAFGLGRYPLTSFGFPPLEEGESLVPFLDPQPIKPDRPMLAWKELDSWLTPPDQFFTVQHYGVPEADDASWTLELTGLIDQPARLSMEQIRARPREEFTATIECAGNGVSPGFMGAVANVRWAGTPLAALLEQAGLQSAAREVVFFGADQGTETIREKEYPQHFARALPLQDVRDSRVMLVYEMDGKPLPKSHGGPLRVGVPGAYGVAWVKWLNRIELMERRFAGRFMGRDYVTIRGEKVGGQVLWHEKLVTWMNLKSITARVVRRPDNSLRITGAAWNSGSTPLDRVELRIDDGPWRRASWGEGLDNPFAWTFWSFDWENPEPGEHTLVSRVIDKKGRVQPSADDPEIALKRTYWEANQQVPRRIEI